MIEFNIDEKYLCDVRVEHYYSLLKNPDIPNAEDLIKILQGKDVAKMISHKDHPEFDKLRKKLSDEGFIKTETWWNGDVVLKPFMFNGVIFRKEDQFPCAAAMKNHLKYKTN